MPWGCLLKRSKSFWWVKLKAKLIRAYGILSKSSYHSTIKLWRNKSLFFLMDSIRPLLGPANVCIYRVSCRSYAKKVLVENNIFVALILIILRLISCNPVTALCRYILVKLKTI